MNVVTEADEDYSREAAAYEYLEETGQTGSFAPAYYGDIILLAVLSYHHLLGRYSVLCKSYTFVCFLPCYLPVTLDYFL